MCTHVESAIHGLSEPDVFVVLALAAPPVLLWYFGDAGVDAGLSSLHVAEDLHGISGAAKIRINPVVTWKNNTSGINELGKAVVKTWSGMKWAKMECERDEAMDHGYFGTDAHKL